MTKWYKALEFHEPVAAEQPSASGRQRASPIGVGMRTANLILALTLCALSTLAFANPRASVTIHGAEQQHRFEVEVAATAQSRSQGLMYRSELADDAGMLFVFERPAEVAFWMRNTFIPLDLIFIDQQGSIVRIHPEAQPHDDTLISSGQPVTHVLEINGGLAAKLGIVTGQRMTLSWPESTDSE